jgi:membrane dipeptidase
MDQRSRNAKELHDRCNVVDAHSDLLALDVWWQHRLDRKGVIEKDHVPRMKKGGIDTRVTVTYNEGYWFPELALKNALDQAVVWNEEFDESPSIARITKFEDIEKAKKDGKIGLILGMEGAEPLSNDINLLQVFYTLGLRMLTLTHANRNYVGDGVHYLPQKEGNVGGITDFGVKVVEECNNLGIVIDVSHLNDPGFWDVMKFSKAPIVASHSNCRALATHPRNLTDDQIKAIIDKDGVIGMNCFSTFVDNENIDLEHYLNHVDHVVNLGGIRNVGLGFDFADYTYKYYMYTEEEVQATFPSIVPVKGLAEDEEVPNVTEGLMNRGYSDEEIELILGKNFLRVFKEVWK